MGKAQNSVPLLESASADSVRSEVTSASGNLHQWHQRIISQHTGIAKKVPESKRQRFVCQLPSGLPSFSSGESDEAFQTHVFKPIRCYLTRFLCEEWVGSLLSELQVRADQG